MKTRTIGYIALVTFASLIPFANWLIGNAGTRCVPDGPCLIPVAPGIEAPSGVVTVGIILTLRDLIHRYLGRKYAVIAILAGSIASFVVAPASFAAASATAFLFSEIADLIAYQKSLQRGFVVAVIVSGLVGLLIDSVIFLLIAFGSLEYLPGQIVGKLWGLMIATAFIGSMRQSKA